MSLNSGDLFICNLEEDDRLHLYEGPFATLVDAKEAMKCMRGGNLHTPVIVKIVGRYQNYIQGKEMFSNKHGMAIADDTEMKIR